MKKIPGVESVETSLSRGRVLIRLKPGNTVKFQDLLGKVRDNGFTTKEATVIVEGEVASQASQWALKIPETGETYPLVFASAGAAKLPPPGGRIVVTGVVADIGARNAANSIRVRAWEAAR